MAGVRRVASKEQVLEHFDDRFLRWQVTPRGWRSAWVTSAAVVIHRVRNGRPQLIGLGRPEALAELLDLAVREVPPGDDGTLWFTVDARAAEALPERLQPEPDRRDHWEWMWTDAEPALLAGEARVSWIGVDDRLRDLLAAANPRHHGRPGDPDIRGWAGVEDDAGRLLAAGALAGLDTGIPHLRSITTTPEARGRGWGAALSAFLTRAALTGSPVVTLGLYSDNPTARRLYQRLGYRCSHTLLSGELARSTSASVRSA